MHYFEPTDTRASHDNGCGGNGSRFRANIVGILSKRKTIKANNPNENKTFKDLGLLVKIDLFTLMNSVALVNARAATHFRPNQ